MKKFLSLTVLALTLNMIPAQAAEVSYKDQKAALATLKVADEVRTGYKQIGRAHV